MTDETFTAILAEMRDFCSGWPEDLDVTVKVGLIYGWMCRLKEAAEREMAKDMSKKLDENRAITGNAAALREALEQAKRDHWFNMLPALRDKIVAALDAPARNCDRFGGDEDKLIEACLNERGLLVTENFRDVFSDWLLAPAKGGAV